MSFLCVFALFSKDFKGSAERKILVFFAGSLLFEQKKSKDWRVRLHTKNAMALETVVIYYGRTFFAICADSLPHSPVKAASSETSP